MSWILYETSHTSLLKFWPVFWFPPPLDNGRLDWPAHEYNPLHVASLTLSMLSWLQRSDPPTSRSTGIIGNIYVIRFLIMNKPKSMSKFVIWGVCMYRQFVTAIKYMHRSNLIRRMCIFRHRAACICILWNVRAHCAACLKKHDAFAYKFSALKACRFIRLHRYTPSATLWNTIRDTSRDPSDVDFCASPCFLNKRSIEQTLNSSIRCRQCKKSTSHPGYIGIAARMYPPPLQYVEPNPVWIVLPHLWQG
jgi:hypothetical protein